MEIDLNDPAFKKRAAEVRRDIEAGEPMTLGDIADRLDMDFTTFAEHVAAELFRLDPVLGGVVVGELVPEVLH